MRKLVLLVAVAAVLAIVIVTVSLSRVRSRVDAAITGLQAELTRRAQLELHGADADLEFLPQPAVVIDGATVVTRKSAGGAAVAEGGRVRIVPRLAGLLTGGSEVERVEIEGVRFFVRPEPKESATLVMGLAPSAGPRLTVRDAVVVLDRGDPQPFQVQDVDLDMTRSEGGVEFAGTAALLGAGSQAEVRGTWRPGAGKTGGDALKLDVRLRDGEREALETLLPSVRTDVIAGPIAVDLSVDGFIGEHSTESAPAEPLAGTLRAEAPIELFGLRQPAIFQSDFTMDDQRYGVDDGKGTWGDRGFDFAGWLSRGAAPRIGLRVGLKEIDVAGVLADYGVDERWRPQAAISGEIRTRNTLAEPLTNYEVRFPSARFDGWPDVPLETGPTRVRGQLLVINADVSASFDMEQMKVAHVTVPDPLVGVRWWRDKLTVTSLGLQMWDGRVDGSLAYEPKVTDAVEAGAMFSGVDAALIAEELFPDAGLDLEGRLDASVQARYADATFGYEGRVGVHDGKMGPQGLVRRIVTQAAAAVGGGNAVGGTLADEYGVLTEGPMPFERLELAYQRRGDDLAFTFSEARSHGATLRGNATRAEDGTVTGDVIVKLDPALVSALSNFVPAFARLAANDGSVAIPARFAGAIADPEVTVDPVFVTAMKNSAQGDGPPAPFVAPVVAPLVELSLPPLEEQFAR